MIAKGAFAETLEFQSTLSVRRATRDGAAAGDHVAISIHALRKESDVDMPAECLHRIISIHALRKESDAYIVRYNLLEQISIHALRKESDSS